MRGFTLVELLIGVSLIGILIALGAPSMATYLQNSKVASAASTLYSGIQLARAEAIRLNVPVQLVMTNDALPATDAAATGASPNAAGIHWFVRAASGADFTLVESKSGTEGGGSATAAAVQVVGTGTSGATPFDGTIAFNGFGAAGAGTAIAIDISNPAGGTCAPAGPIRCRRIAVAAGGQITSCDPAALTGDDTRAC